MRRIFFEILQWTWCLPQTALGTLLFCILSISGRVRSVQSYRETWLVRCSQSKLMSGLSLGKWIFVTPRGDDEDTRKHEYGHTLQSYILGPLYLIIVGIPSEYWLVRSHFNEDIRKTYRERFPENWADSLAGITKRKK